MARQASSSSRPHAQLFLPVETSLQNVVIPLKKGIHVWTRHDVKDVLKAKRSNAVMYPASTYLPCPDGIRALGPHAFGLFHDRKMDSRLRGNDEALVRYFGVIPAQAGIHAFLTT